MKPKQAVDGRRVIVKNKRYAPATGIQSDFEKTLTAFVKTKSVRYEEFAKIWREKKLSLIWAGRWSDREAIEVGFIVYIVLFYFIYAFISTLCETQLNCGHKSISAVYKTANSYSEREVVSTGS
jgi:hypothetical protein